MPTATAAATTAAAGAAAEDVPERSAEVQVLLDDVIASLTLPSRWEVYSGKKKNVTQYCADMHERISDVKLTRGLPPQHRERLADAIAAHLRPMQNRLLKIGVTHDLHNRFTGGGVGAGVVEQYITFVKDPVWNLEMHVVPILFSGDGAVETCKALEGDLQARFCVVDGGSLNRKKEHCHIYAAIFKDAATLAKFRDEKFPSPWPTFIRDLSEPAGRVSQDIARQLGLTDQRVLPAAVTSPASPIGGQVIAPHQGAPSVGTSTLELISKGRVAKDDEDDDEEGKKENDEDDNDEDEAEDDE